MSLRGEKKSLFANYNPVERENINPVINKKNRVCAYIYRERDRERLRERQREKDQTTLAEGASLQEVSGLNNIKLARSEWSQ